MVKKILTFTIIIILLSGLALWSPWSAWDFSLMRSLGLEQEENHAGLQVYSIAGEIEVLIDNQVTGNVTVEGSPLDIFDIQPGNHLVTLRRVSQDTEMHNYYEFNRMLNFIEGVNIVLAYEIGPSQNFSSGYTIYATRSISENESHLNVRTVPDGAKVFLNSNEITSTPVSNYKLDLDQTYQLKINKDDFESIEFSLLPEAKEERDALKGFDLNVEATLFRLPLETRQE